MPGPIIEAPPPDLTKKGSPNKAMIDSLISTLQRNEIIVPDDKVRKLGLEWKPAKLYDAIRKMDADLNKAYDALFDGPLPAVDGYNLTRLNAANLNGPIPESYNIAYTDRSNNFARGQSIIWNDDTEPLLKLGFGSLFNDPALGVILPASYFRFGSIIDEDFFISQNLFYGTTWTQDDDTIGSSRMDFIEGDIIFNWFDDLISDMRRTFTIRGREIKYASFDQTVDPSLFYISDDDVIKIGSDADGSGLPFGWPAIPTAPTGNLPTAGVTANGIIGIDKTVHAIVFYANGLRYKAVGVAF